MHLWEHSHHRLLSVHAVKMLTVSVVLLILLSTTLVCDAEDNNCEVAGERLLMLDRIIKSDIPKKPITGKLVNYCSRFENTCCNKGLEDKLADETSKNFKQDLDNIVTSQRAFCKTMKTHLLSAIKDAFKESFLRGVIPRIGLTNITGKGNIRQLLSPLYTYLSQYEHKNDICSLSGIIDLQLLKIARKIFQNQVGDSECFEATMKQYNVKHVRNIMEELEPLLGRLRYLQTGYLYRNKIIEFLSSYRASPTCLKGLMLMTFCSICTQVTMTPCHNLCLNTIQGCLVDFADLNLSVTKLVMSLEKIKSQLHFSSHINNLGIKLQRYILGLNNDSGLIKQKLITNNCLPADYKRDLMSNNLRLSPDYRRGLMSNNLHLSPNVDDALPPMTNDEIDVILSDAINNEFKCLKYITLLNAPYKMCTERYFTSMKNLNCWAASPTGPWYTAPVADFTRHALEEKLNPEFQDEPIPKMTELNINIRRFTIGILDLEDNYQHQYSDDEDYKKFPYLFQAKCADDYSIEASGSGDGSAVEPMSSGSMPTPRVHIMTVGMPSKPSLPPMITTTNSTSTVSPNTQPDEPIATDTNISDNNTTTGDTSNTDINFTPNTSNQNSGTSILYLELHHLLLPLMLGILYII